MQQFKIRKLSSISADREKVSLQIAKSPPSQKAPAFHQVSYDTRNVVSPRFAICKDYAG